MDSSVEGMTHPIWSCKIPFLGTLFLWQNIYFPLKTIYHLKVLDVKASLIFPCCIVNVTFGSCCYKSAFVIWLFQETLSAILSIPLHQPPNCLFSALVNVHVSAPCRRTESTIARNSLTNNFLANFVLHTFLILWHAF